MFLMTVRGIVRFPYTIGHMMDATAQWNSIEVRHQAQRLRSILFVDGFTQSAYWDLNQEGNPADILTIEGFEESCRIRGMFDRSEPNPDLDVAVIDQMNRAEGEIRQASEGIDPASEGAVEDTIANLRTLFGQGMPDLDSASLMSAAMRPMNLHAREAVPVGIPDGPNREVMGAIQKRISDSGMTFDEMVTWVCENHGGCPDVVGPALIASAGFQRDDRRAIARAAPGPSVDPVHTMFVPRCAVFVTGDYKLARRLQVWFEYTQRGPSHGRWPVVQYLCPDDPTTIDETTELIRHLVDLLAADRLAG